MDVYQRRRLVALSALAVLFIVFVLLIRSCGGDDETTPVTPVAGATGLSGATVLAQSDYVTQGDAICLEANTSLAGVDQTDAAQAATDQAEIVTSELQQLQSLPPPDDGTNKLDNFLGALEAQATAYQDKATALDHGDDAAAAEIDATIDEAATEAADAADNFGFKVCGDLTKVGESDTSGGDSASTTDSGGTAPSTEPVVPAETTTPPVTETPTDTGAATPDAPVTPPTDTGGTDPGSGGVSP